MQIQEEKGVILLRSVAMLVVSREPTKLVMVELKLVILRV